MSKCTEYPLPPFLRKSATLRADESPLRLILIIEQLTKMANAMLILAQAMCQIEKKKRSIVKSEIKESIILNVSHKAK